MKPPLIYVELKSGYADNGPAWIGRAEYSKSRKMIYFNGMALRQLTRRQNFETHSNPETGDRYWVSGVKKNQADRHWAGSGIITIDEAVVADYLQHVGASSLSKSRYNVIRFADNTAIRRKATEKENMKIANHGHEGTSDPGRQTE
jgi:hypothetical protein